MFVDVGCGGGLGGVEIRVEAVEAVVDVFLPGGCAAIGHADTWNAVLVDAVVNGIGLKQESRGRMDYKCKQPSEWSRALVNSGSGLLP